MVICYIPLCKSRSDRGRNVDKDGNKITFHEFPSDPERRQLWITAIKHQGKIAIKPWKPEKTVDKSVICSLHFEPSDFKPGLRTRWLMSTAVPSIFPDSQGYMKTTRKPQKVKSEERDKPITVVACDKSSEPGESALELQKPVADSNGPIISTLPFQPSNFGAGFKVLCLLPVPSLFSNYAPCVQSTSIIQRVGGEGKDNPVIKTECDKTTVTGNTSSVKPAQGSMSNESIENRKSIDATEKDSVSSVEECFTYSKVLKNLSLIKKPNQFWGVTPTDKFTIFSRWNEKYIPEKRIVIDNGLNSKIFLGELEINAMNLMEFTCAEDISALLEKVENVKFLGKEPVINHYS